MASDPLLGPMLVEHDAEALTRCLLTLFDDALPSLEVLNDAGVPLLLYCGAEDPYRTNMELAAGQLRFELTVVQGDHIHALADPSIVDPVCRFFETRMED